MLPLNPCQVCGTCNRMNLFGHGARLHSEMEPGLNLEKEPHLEMEPACLEMEPTALFGNRARPHPETEHGSI